MDRNAMYRRIPKVDILLADDDIQCLIEEYSREVVMDAVRTQTDALRRFIGRSEDEKSVQERIDRLKCDIRRTVEQMYRPNMRRVINATGTVLHTNLGRAPLNPRHMQRAAELISGYSNLEYHLESGVRGERYAHFEKLLCKITGAEAAMAVNNNASSVLLILNALAHGGEVIVSRGELVEIGGKFRIPDVMKQSNAILREVGTTNKTHPEDYEEAVTEETKAILKVHTSNYRIVGFTESVGIEQLVSIAEKNGLPVIQDLGSGVLINLEKYGLRHEPTVQESVKKGADLVCFSGDKLLGGPQAGIIVGKKKYIDMLKRNQLTRALRIDKFTAAVLELVLQEYLSEENAVRNIPVLRMITKPYAEVAEDAKCMLKQLEHKKNLADITLQPCESQIGGGSLPLLGIASMAVAIRPKEISAGELERRLRHLPVPVIARIVNDHVLLDMRTVGKDEMGQIAEQFAEHRVFEVSDNR